MVKVVAGALLGLAIEVSVLHLRKWFRNPRSFRNRISAVMSFWRGWGVSPRGFNRLAVPFAVMNAVTGICVAVVAPMLTLYSKEAISRPVFVAVFLACSGILVISVAMALFVYLFGRPRRLLLCASRTASDAEVLEALGLDPRGR